MHIEVLSAANAMQYKSVMLHAYEHAADAFTSTPDERAKEPDSWWVKRIADPEKLTVAFGVFDNSHLIGTVALEFSPKPKTKHKALVVGMYVMPNWREKGVARALLQAAIEHCVTRGDIRSVQLEVTDGNAPALALYEKWGFETDEVRMWKQL